MLAFQSASRVAFSAALPLQHAPFQHIHEHAWGLARRAYEAARGDIPLPRMDAGEGQETAIIRSVALALSRAFDDPEFSQLTPGCQEDAAVMLTCQCLYGMRVAHALQGALLNPATMAHQLKSNALDKEGEYNVFAYIIGAHHPRTTVAGETVRRLHALA